MATGTSPTRLVALVSLPRRLGTAQQSLCGSASQTDSLSARPERQKIEVVCARRQMGGELCGRTLEYGGLQRIITLQFNTNGDTL